MATALTAQLAQLRKQGNVNALDLKAQRQAHAQSLVFDESHAATQDFDTIYQFCLEGFDELCQLDGRFLGFASTIFGEQSKSQDRTQMTEIQNKELDDVLEECLCLIGSKILLKPAIKTTEWLIRRFRVHIHNTSTLLLTFLPYHANPLFVTLLSLLPKVVPSDFKFLQPYIQSRASLPRHTIVHTARTNKFFLSALSVFTLETCRFGYQYPALISFWASITTEAVVSMADQTLSARLEAQQENQGNVLRLMLPVLNDAFRIKDNPDLRIACYTIVTAIAVKFDLDDRAISIFMDAVSLRWGPTAGSGLICLAILAEHRPLQSLPSKTLKAVLSLQDLGNDLGVMQAQYEIKNLVVGILLGIFDTSGRHLSNHEVALASRLLTSLSMPDTHLYKTLEYIMSAIRSAMSKGDTSTAHALVDLLLNLADSSSQGQDVRAKIVGEYLNDPTALPPKLRMLVDDSHEKPSAKSASLPRAESPDPSEQLDFDALASQIPSKTAFEMSFLSSSESFVYGSLSELFLAIHNSKSSSFDFCELSVLRKSLAMAEPLFFSFFIRFWCSQKTATARASAIHIVRSFLQNEAVPLDVQMLIPYVVHGLADQSQRVRRASADLVKILSKVFADFIRAHPSTEARNILGRDQIYGQNGRSQKVAWMTSEDALRLLEDILTPDLDECVLHEQHASILIAAAIQGHSHSQSHARARELKRASRSSIFAFLCSHAVNSPLYSFKLRLLSILNGIDHVGSVTRTRLLFPILSEMSKLAEHDARVRCEREELDINELARQTACIAIPREQDGIQLLENIACGKVLTRFPILERAAMQRIETIWPQMSHDQQSTVASKLFARALSQSSGAQDVEPESIMVELLCSVKLSTSILESQVEALSPLCEGPGLEQRASKRIRTSHGALSIAEKSNASPSENAIQRASLIMQIIESCRPEEHPGLFGPLFVLLSELLSIQSQSSPALNYLQLSMMDLILSIAAGHKMSPDKLDISMIRADVLVECIRTTNHTQVRNKALLLIVTLAEVAPHLILHNVMPIFTYMGATVLRQDDEYSSYLVQQIMESVVSKLVSKIAQNPKAAFPATCELLLSFAAAAEHMPSQRRLPLFISLIEKVGCTQYLFALLVILADKYPGSSSIMQLSVELFSHYESMEQLQTLCKLMEIVRDALQPKRSQVLQLLSPDQSQHGSSTAITLLSLASRIFRSSIFRKKWSKDLKMNLDQSHLLRGPSINIFEQLFLISQKCQNNDELNASFEQAMSAFLRAIPVGEFLHTLEKLFNNANDPVRLQIITTIEKRLEQGVEDQSFGKACLEFVPQLSDAIRQSDSPALHQSAIRAIDKISDRFGKRDLSGIVDAARGILEGKAFTGSDQNLQAVSLLCLSTMIQISGEAIVAVVPDILTRTMKCLDLSIGVDTEDPDLHNAAFQVIHVILEYIPWIVTGRDLDRILQAVHESANAEMGARCDHVRRECLRAIPRTENAKECLLALDRTWKSAYQEGAEAIKEHFQILRLAIDKQSKHKLMQQCELLGTLLIKAFNQRHFQLSPRTSDSFSDGEIDDVENVVIETTIALIYKLNDASFRPMFTRFHEWAANSDDEGGRHVFRLYTWYNFLSQFFSTLKSIVTKYAAIILDDAISILGNIEPESPDFMQLWRQVLLALQQTFEHDRDEFYRNPSHFHPICTALLAQLSHADQIPMSPEIIPAITELAVASDSDTQHKEMNTALLQHTRSEDAAVRLAAVRSQRSLTNRLGEDWLALLPEMLPVINELQEDDNEAVEMETLGWIKKIEEIIGESIDPMLQ